MLDRRPVRSGPFGYACLALVLSAACSSSSEPEGKGEDDSGAATVDVASPSPSDAAMTPGDGPAAPDAADGSMDAPDGEPDAACLSDGGACATATLCKTASLACVGGVLQCHESGNVADGTSCGANLFCVTGSCVACTAGASCVPAASACHTGAIACPSGTCVDTGTNAAAGTACGANQVCDGNNACVACTPGASCVPANACHVGAVACAAGKSCTDTATNVANGTACAGGTCQSGACVLTQTIAVFGGDNQSAPVDAALANAATVTVSNANGPVAGATVTVTVPAGAVAIPSSGVTDAQEHFSTALRVGRAVGAYAFTMTTSLAGAPLTINATASAPASGVVFTPVNISHAAGNAGVPGPGTVATTSRVFDVTAAADGTLYLADFDNFVI
jgi:hypothetical protein